MRDQFFGEEV